MELNQLQEFIARENQRLQKHHTGLDAENAPLVQTVKINEEIGELCDTVLAYDSLQRTEKLDEFGKTDIEDEVADVIITTLLLAETVGIDIESALEEKIERIEKRYE
jgi:NTP pyrophosphatase (non-canonical NTP hydrolase)